jgi:hypothetical protein
VAKSPSQHLRRTPTAIASREAQPRPVVRPSELTMGFTDGAYNALEAQPCSPVGWRGPCLVPSGRRVLFTRAHHRSTQAPPCNGVPRGASRAQCRPMCRGFPANGTHRDPPWAYTHVSRRAVSRAHRRCSPKDDDRSATNGASTGSFTSVLRVGRRGAPSCQNDQRITTGPWSSQCCPCGWCRCPNTR